MTTTATNALTVRPRRRAPVWISIVNTGTVAVVLCFYALPSGATYLVVLYALVLVLSAVTVWALVSDRSRLAQTLLAATVLLALPAVAIWAAVLAFIALAILVALPADLGDELRGWLQEAHDVVGLQARTGTPMLRGSWHTVADPAESPGSEAAGGRRRGMVRLRVGWVGSAAQSQ